MRVLRRFVGALVMGVVVLAIVGVATGRLASVVTNGTSMLPRYERGDLVLVWRSDAYSIGDVAAYRDPASAEVVLHRIVGGDASGFDLRGDHNTSLDDAHPAADELIGSQVLHVPGAGRVLGAPLVQSALAGVLVVLAALALVGGSPARQDPATTPAPTAPGTPSRPRRLRWWHAIVLAVDGAAIGGLVAAFAIPPTVVPAEPAPMHAGELGYTAAVPRSDATPDGTIVTGQPVFAKQADRVDVVFRYSGEADLVADARLDLRLGAPAGWNTTVSLAAPTPIIRGGAEVHATIDLPSLYDLLDRVETTTGQTLSAVQATLTATVEPDGTAASADAAFVRHPYELALVFRLDDLGLHPTEENTVVTTDAGPVVALTAPLTDEVAEPREVGGVPREARRWAVVAVLVALAATVTFCPPAAGAPAHATSVDAPDEASPPSRPMEPVRVLRVTDVDLPPVAMRVRVAARRELDAVAAAATVPVFERADGWAAVVTDHAVHWWEPVTIPDGEPVWAGSSAALPPPVSPAAGRDTPTAVRSTIDEIVAYLADRPSLDA